jgi:hypothetical protein
MRKLVFVSRENSCSTPETIAEDCRRRGHLVAIDRDPYLNGVRKYYLFEGKFEDKRPMEITIVNNRVVSARRVPEAVLKTLPPLTPPQFGNF